MNPSERTGLRIDLWADVICPWCYIGAARLQRVVADFEHSDQVHIVHRSFELDPGRARSDVQPVGTMLHEKFGPKRRSWSSG